MVGLRIAPDNNDLAVWKLDESAAPFVNSSTSPSAPSHANSDLGTLSGTVLLQQPSPFAPFGSNSCVIFSGNNSGSPRNFISGATGFNPQPPFTVSGWLFLRNYNTTGFTQHWIAKQTAVGQWSGTSFATITISNRTYAGGPGPQQCDFFVQTSTTSGGQAIVPVESTITLNNWCHVGLTYDGTTVQAFINGNLLMQATASPTGNVLYGGSPGPWFVGAIPSGSGNPEESVISVCDIRVANIVRPTSYFRNIFTSGISNAGQQISVVTRFYRMRAFDSFYTTTPVYWTDTDINYNNAPDSPSGFGLGPIEIVDTWTALNV